MKIDVLDSNEEATSTLLKSFVASIFDNLETSVRVDASISRYGLSQ